MHFMLNFFSLLLVPAVLLLFSGCSLKSRSRCGKPLHLNQLPQQCVILPNLSSLPTRSSAFSPSPPPTKESFYFFHRSLYPCSPVRQHGPPITVLQKSLLRAHAAQAGPILLFLDMEWSSTANHLQGVRLCLKPAISPRKELSSSISGPLSPQIYVWMISMFFYQCLKLIWMDQYMPLNYE